MEFAKKIKGVSYDSKSQKYRAYITFKKNRVSLGYYKDITEAIKARKSIENVIKEGIEDNKYFLIELGEHLMYQDTKDALSVTKSKKDFYVFIMLFIISSYVGDLKGDFDGELRKIIISKFNNKKLIDLKKSSNQNFACYALEYIKANYDIMFDIYNALKRGDYSNVQCLDLKRQLNDFDQTFNCIKPLSIDFLSGSSMTYITKKYNISKAQAYRDIQDDLLSNFSIRTCIINFLNDVGDILLEIDNLNPKTRQRI